MNQIKKIISIQYNQVIKYTSVIKILNLNFKGMVWIINLLGIHKME